MEIQGKNVLVLGGFGLVGNAVCRELMPHEPARVVIASLRREEALQAVEMLQQDYAKTSTKILPTWGDFLLRSEWQQDAEGAHPRIGIVADTDKRRRLVADILDELDDEIIQSSLLYQMIMGEANDLDGKPAHVIIDCVNTATAVAYQNVFESAHRIRESIADKRKTDWPQEF